jgi:hypothetical protein
MAFPSLINLKKQTTLALSLMTLPSLSLPPSPSPSPSSSISFSLRIVSIYLTRDLALNRKSEDAFISDFAIEI